MSTNEELLQHCNDIIGLEGPRLPKWFIEDREQSLFEVGFPVQSPVAVARLAGALQEAFERGLRAAQPPTDQPAVGTDNYGFDEAETLDMPQAHETPRSQALLDDVTFTKVGRNVSVPKVWMDKFIEATCELERELSALRSTESVQLLEVAKVIIWHGHNALRRIERAPVSEIERFYDLRPLMNEWLERSGFGLGINFNEADKTIADFAASRPADSNKGGDK